MKGRRSRWCGRVLRGVRGGVVSALQVVTFDGYGVSGHRNHTSVYRGVQRLIQSEVVGPRQAWCLRSTSKLRKFLGVVEVPLSCLECWARPSVRLTLNDEPMRVHRAMRAHHTQYVWYRRLYVLVSRYCIVNTLVPLRG